MSERKCPRQDSNLRSRLRRAVLYPLSYEGVAAWADGASADVTSHSGVSASDTAWREGTWPLRSPV